MRFLLVAVFLQLFMISNSWGEDKLNIILIMLDDSGWTDFGCYGSEIETPNIDQVAKEGMRFTDCHSAAPNCSPARAGILTGRTPSRVGMYSYRPPNHPMHLRSEEITVAELLKEKGYNTGHFGKWHLSTLLNPDQADPADQGFDYSLGTDNNASPNHLNPVNYVLNGKEVGKMKGYSCQIVVDETIQWMERIDAAKNPFFACVWFHEPHTPIASPSDIVQKYQKKFPKLSKKEATYYANIENVDKATGRLMAHLKKIGIDEKTMVMITSDNGGLHKFSNGDLRGKKSNVWEGGHRVPGIFRWPGKIPAGKESDVPVCGLDFLPTVCEFTEIELPKVKIDGASIAGLLTGKSETLKRETPLYWFFYRLNPGLTLREGRWALVADTNDAQRPKTHPLAAEDMPFIKGSKPVKFMLYDLRKERAQQTDVSKQYPEVLDKLKKKMIEMHKDVLSESPNWQIDSSSKRGKAKVWDSYK
ncbi:MAG: sulfatase [Lentisphaerales bacterium]|nr:sulfatase [Lentisphaerales bacterium]